MFSQPNKSGYEDLDQSPFSSQFYPSNLPNTPINRVSAEQKPSDPILSKSDSALSSTGLNAEAELSGGTYQAAPSLDLAGRDSPPGGYGASSGYGGLCSPGGSHIPTTSAESKLDALKSWSISTYKCTRQAISEKLGKTTRTMDVEIEQSIDSLREIQSRYQTVLRLARALASHFANVLECQRALAAEFSSLVSKEPELAEELKYNAETQKTLVTNGEHLLASLNFFVNSLNTMCNKTIDDTLLTIKTFESIRLEYDAYRSDLENLQQSTSRGGDFQAKLHDAQQNVSNQKVRYEQLRQDVQVKMKFLNENKIKVLQNSCFYSTMRPLHTSPATRWVSAPLCSSSAFDTRLPTVKMPRFLNIRNI